MKQSVPCNVLWRKLLAAGKKLDELFAFEVNKEFQMDKKIEEMATIKVKFRASIIKDKEGSLYYQVIHNRIVKQIKTEYKILPGEWGIKSSEIILPLDNENRKEYLLSIKKCVQSDINKLIRIIKILDKKGTAYSIDDIIAAYQSSEDSLYTFMQDVIIRLKQSGKIRTSETYTTTLNSFKRFRKGVDIMLDEIDADLMVTYETFLKKENVTMNTISFYMRILRAVYNRAVEKELITSKKPFREVYTGIPKTIKRAIPLKAIKQIKALDLTLYPSLDYARDMFLFSFYTRGMSFIDIAYLRKEDIENDILTYQRRKTRQQIHVKWESCMQEIVDKYPINDSPYLLPIIKKADQDERKQYKNAILFTNRKLKILGKAVNISIPLTMYVARHSWASIAKSKNIPISVISEGMGHNSEATTQIYLASLETSVIDRANELILRSL